MPTYLRAPTKTFECGAALNPNLRVKVSSAGVVTAAGAADMDIGTTVTTTRASGEDVTVALASLEGTAVMTASEAIDIGEAVYGAASGKVGLTDTNHPVGIALSAAAADDDELEVLRMPIVPNAGA